MKVLVTAVHPDERQWRSFAEGFCINVDPADNTSSTDLDSVLAVHWGIKGEKEARALVNALISSREPFFADIDPDEFISVRETGLLTDFLTRVRDNLVYEAQAVYKQSHDQTL
jgi:hypothetical protein